MTGDVSRCQPLREKVCTSQQQALKDWKPGKDVDISAFSGYHSRLDTEDDSLWARSGGNQSEKLFIQSLRVACLLCDGIDTVVLRREQDTGQTSPPRHVSTDCYKSCKEVQVVTRP